MGECTVVRWEIGALTGLHWLILARNAHLSPSWSLDGFVPSGVQGIPWGRTLYYGVVPLETYPTGGRVFSRRRDSRGSAIRRPHEERDGACGRENPTCIRQAVQEQTLPRVSAPQQSGASGAALPQQVLQRCASCSEARVELLP